MTGLEWNIHYPYYIYPSESTTQSLSNMILEGGNHHSWNRDIKRSLGSKSKLCFIIDNPAIVKPKFGDKLYDK